MGKSKPQTKRKLTKIEAKNHLEKFLAKFRAASPMERRRMFRSAPQKVVKSEKRVVEKILDITGHPEAYVTDRSSLHDFTMNAKKDAEILRKMSKVFGKVFHTAHTSMPFVELISYITKT